MSTSIANEILYQCVSENIITDTEKLRDILALILSNYDISPKETNLAVVDNGASKGYQMFFVAKKVEGLKEKSLKYYKSVIDSVLLSINKPIEDITSDDIRCYLAIKSREGSSNVTLNNIRHALSSFFTFLVNEGYVEKNPISIIKCIRCKKEIKRPFTPIDIEKILDVARNQKRELASKRDVAMIETLLSTGCRVGELCSIKINDVDFRKGDCIIMGKGSKERHIFFNDRALLRVSEYLDIRKDDCEYLFTALRGPYERLSTGAVERAISQLGKLSKVNDCHPHRFRRTMACNAMKKGMPIEQIQALLGHEDISTTKIYLCIDTDNLAVEHKKYLG